MNTGTKEASKIKITLAQNKDKSVGARVRGATFEKIQKIAREKGIGCGTVAGEIVERFIDEVEFV
jgi:hypothetical protein